MLRSVIFSFLEPSCDLTDLGFMWCAPSIKNKQWLFSYVSMSEWLYCVNKLQLMPYELKFIFFSNKSKYLNLFLAHRVNLTLTETSYFRLPSCQSIGGRTIGATCYRCISALCWWDLAAIWGLRRRCSFKRKKLTTYRTKRGVSFQNDDHLIS